jgi:hypothetical protein
MLFYGVGSTQVDGVLGGSDRLLNLSENAASFTIGIAFMLVNSVVVIAIGLLIRPVLRSDNNGRTANHYLLTRAIEGGVLAFGALVLFAARNARTDTAIEAAIATNFNAYQIAMAVLGIGSIGFCLLLLRTKLVPRQLALLGVVGYAALFAGAVLELSGVGVGLAMSIPGGLFELILPVWLFTKGFSHQVEGSASTKSVVLV